MKRKTNKRKHLVLLLVLSMLMANILCACGSSNEVAVTSTKEETTSVKEKIQPEVVETEEATPAEESEAVEETETEAEEIENLEPVEYEGIDLNSTLPAYEWVKESFPGVMDNFKMVVYNDNTNYKVILEDGQSVEFHKDDKLLTYCAGSAEVEEITQSLGYFEDEDEDFIASDFSYGIYNYYDVDEEIWDEGEMEISFAIKDEGKEYEVTSTLIFVE